MSEPFAPTTIPRTLIETAKRRPGHEALVFPPHDRFAYAELLDRSIEAARSLAGLGVRRGDHVGLLMPNCPDFVFAFYGAQLLGAVAVPINTRFRTRELGYVVENADLVCLLTSDIVEERVDYADRLVESVPGLAGADDTERLELEVAPRLRAVVLLGAGERPGLLSRSRFGELGAGVDDADVLREAFRAGPDDVALMLYTSGTTAQPKGCLITHDAALGVWCESARELQVTEDDRMWDALPLFHMSCLGPLLFTVELGGTLISHAHFEPGSALDALEREDATWMYSVFPPIIMALIKDPSFASRDISRVRGLLNVAPVETMHLIERAFPGARNVGGHFGMTEASGAITCNPWEGTRRQHAETHGPPLPGVEVIAVDPETGDERPPGIPGELLVRGRGLMRGYHRDSELTAEAVRGGWLHSGDLGVVDEDGFVTYLSRLKDMLKVGGENVAPAEIESHLSTHPAVKLVQVVGAPDERLGEVVAAFVELAAGQTWTEEEAIAFCHGQVAGYKVPRYVRFVDEWPMSATKIQKFRLRELIKDELTTPEL
ncbi:MAG: AMP-binding protein [Actinobacteria bacterium]|nr:AMP-binding protein [Actinomycetota bacterium]